MSVIQKKLSILGLIWLGVNMATITTSCRKDDKSETSPSYDAKFIKLTGDQISLADCDAQGVACNEPGRRTANVSDVFARYEESLGIPSLKAAIAKTDGEKTQMTQDLLKLLNGKDASVELARLSKLVGDLEKKISDIDSVLDRGPSPEPYLIQNRNLAASDLAAAKSQRDRIITATGNIAEKNAQVAMMNADLLTKEADVSLSKAVFGSLLPDEAINTSTLNEKLSWLADIIFAVAEKK
jgi:hypothetical protein